LEATEHVQRYGVVFPDHPMVAYCAKGIAGVKHSGALLLDHLMSHQPCHTLHTLHPTHPPPSPPPHPSFLCIHISRYVYTHIRWVYTREGFVYAPKHHLCIHKILGLVYTPKHHLCIHQNIICVYTKSRARCSCVYTYVLCIHKNRVVYTQIFSCVQRVVLGLQDRLTLSLAVWPVELDGL
jgi:hypothetical protein